MTLLEPAAAALEVAHQHNVAHRDLKPANLVVMGDARIPGVPVKVLDFGIAKVMAQHEELKEQLALTGQQVSAFTPNYGAPEQFSRNFGATGPWTDVYAMALILLELVRGGRRVLDGQTFFELGVQSCDPSTRPTPRTLGLPFDEAVEAVFAKALTLHPRDRYPRMGEFWNELCRLTTPGQGTWRPMAAARAAFSSRPGATGPAPGAVITPLSISGGSIDTGTVNLPGTSQPGGLPHTGEGDRISMELAPTMATDSRDPSTMASMARALDAQPRPRRAPVVIGALAAVALVAGAVWWLGSPTTSVAPAPAAAATETPSAATPPTTATATATVAEAPPPAATPTATASATATVVQRPGVPGRPKEPPPPPPSGANPWDPSSFGDRR